MGRFKLWTEQKLQESSLARVYQHTKERNIGIISASRGDLPDAENKKRHQELKAHVRKNGYGYIRTKGRYVENHGKKNARSVDERGVLVVGSKGDDGGKLKSFLKSTGERFGQDSVLHKSSHENHASLHGTNATGHPGKGKSANVGKWHPNRTGEFYTMMKNKPRTFAFEEFEFYPEKSFFLRKNRLF